MFIKFPALFIGITMVFCLISVNCGETEDENEILEDSHEVNNLSPSELKDFLDLLTYIENNDSREDSEKRSIFLPRIGTEKRASIFLPRIGSEKRAFHMPRVGRSNYKDNKKAVHMPRIGK